MAKVCYVGSDFKLDMSRCLRMRGCSGNTTPLAFDKRPNEPCDTQRCQVAKRDLQE